MERSIIAFNQEKTSNSKKRKIRIEKVKSPYELMLPQLSIRSHLINGKLIHSSKIIVFYHMLHYNASFNSIDGFAAYILEDLLVMRINHVNNLYENYHVKLIQLVSELFLCSYPKHIFPLALFCFQRGFYSDHANIKAASIYGLKICESIVHCQKNPPEPFLLPFSSHQTEKETEVDKCLSNVAPFIGNDRLDMKLSNYEIDNERIGVSESAVEFSKENSEIKVAHSQPLSLTKESILGNKEHIESVVQMEFQKEDMEENHSSYIKLDLEDSPIKEADALAGSKEVLKNDRNLENLDSDETIVPNDNENINFEIEIGNESDGSDGSMAFSIPEINIESSDEEA